MIKNTGMKWSLPLMMMDLNLLIRGMPIKSMASKLKKMLSRKMTEEEGLLLTDNFFSKF